MKINLGCGDHYAPGWTNVDAVSNDVVKPDVVADIMQGLPFQDIENIYAGHVLEHIPHDRVIDALRHWKEKCVAGAELVIVGPDCDRGEAMVRAGEMHHLEYELLLHGGERWPGDAHLWRCTESEVMRLAAEAGWLCRAVLVGSLFGTMYPLVSGVTWQFALICEKGPDEEV